MEDLKVGDIIEFQHWWSPIWIKAKVENTFNGMLTSGSNINVRALEDHYIERLSGIKMIQPKGCLYSFATTGTKMRKVKISTIYKVI